MTVKELMKILETCDPDMIVAIDNGEHVVDIDEISFYHGFVEKIILG